MGNCYLGKCTFGKSPLGKLSLGKSPLGKEKAFGKELNTVVVNKWNYDVKLFKIKHTEIRVLQRSIESSNKRYFPQKVLLCTLYKYCTRPISRHLYSRIFKDPLDM